MVAWQLQDYFPYVSQQHFQITTHCTITKTIGRFQNHSKFSLILYTSRSTTKYVPSPNVVPGVRVRRTLPPLTPPQNYKHHPPNHPSLSLPVSISIPLITSKSNLRLPKQRLQHQKQIVLRHRFTRKPQRTSLV
jgi:hypothetical protein